jgi:hypothetical protein
MNGAIHAGSDEWLSGLVIFNNGNRAASLKMNSFGEGLELQFQRGSEDDGRSPEGIQCLVEAFRVAALRDDPEVVLHGEDFGGACSKDCLIIGKDDLVHCDLLSFFK